MRESPERERRLDEVVAAYLEAVEAGDAPDRGELLRRHPDLADELAAFFADEEQFDSLMAPLRPPAVCVPSVTPQPPTLRPALTPAPGGRRNGSAPGPSCGDYELLEEVARGGMGVVFKARQRSLNRVVALKMILGGRLASAADVQRFRLEAEAAANLDHPNIVPIYEVGEWRGDDVGPPAPFFSMKLIEGGSLAQHDGCYVSRPREAVRLMVQVARAVDHAHRRGILHRDLKPANVLLARGGGEPPETPPSGGSRPPLAEFVPYVTDFGLAKRVGGNASLTQSGTAVGTPSYMAPEQASGRRSGLTVAADVYSLGAILYELLTGRPPFKAEVPLETLLQVVHQEPTSPRSLNPRVDRDLSTVVLKCLDKEPQRRYASAAVLADDLERYLEGEPVRARPAGRLERLGRWCRRNPALAVTAALAVAALLAVTAVSLLLYLREADNADHLADLNETLRAEKEQTQNYLVALEAEKEKTQKALTALQAEEGKTQDALDQAKRHAAESDESFRDAHKVLNNFVVRISDELSRTPSTLPLRKEMLGSALEYYRKFLARRGDDPGLKADLAHAAFQAGHITSSIGSKAEALKLYQQALDLYEELAAARPDDPSFEGEAVRTLSNISILQASLGRRQDAVQTCRRTLELSERRARERPADPDRLHDLAFNTHGLAVLMRDEGEFEESLPLFEQARVLWEQLACAHPRSARYPGDLALCLNNSAIVLSQLGRLPEATWRFEAALAIRERLAQDFPRAPEYQIALAASYHDLGVNSSRLNRTEEASAYYQRALALREQLARDHPSVSQYQADVAGSLFDLGDDYHDRKKLTDAFDCFNRALGILQKLADADPDVAGYKNELAKAHYRVGLVLADNKQRQDAAKAFRKARDLQQKVVAADPARLDYHRDLSLTLGHLGLVQAQMNQFDDGIAALKEAVEQGRAAFDRAPLVPSYRSTLSSAYGTVAEVYRTTGRPAESAEALRQKRLLWPENPSMLFAVACDLAATADVVGRGKDPLGDAERAEKQVYEDDAMATLRQAVAAGFRDPGRLESDPRLAALRKRADFPSLLKSAP